MLEGGGEEIDQNRCRSCRTLAVTIPVLGGASWAGQTLAIAARCLKDVPQLGLATGLGQVTRRQPVAERADAGRVGVTGGARTMA